MMAILRGGTAGLGVADTNSERKKNRMGIGTSQFQLMAFMIS